jgi:lipopolysaccharide export system protein LptA
MIPRQIAIAGLSAVAIICGAAASARAQQAPAKQCILQYESSSGNTRTNAIKLPSERYNVFQGGGVTYHCEGQDNTLIADSAEYYGDNAILYMIGNVHYSENRAKVDSDRMTYFQTEDRLRAEGNVNVRTQTGTTIKGPVIDYYRATTTRPLARTIASQRPHMTIVQKAAATGKPSEPADVDANTIVAEGDNLVYASGNVQIARPDILAKSDSAFLDGTREFARLMRTPSVQSRKGRPFTLTGGIIDLYSKNKLLERVVATPTGHVLSQDLELLADSVDLRVKDNQLQQVMAWGSKSRAKALSPDREVTADSIDARMPGQRLREVRAVGKAYANSAPDTAHIISTARDWMKGDSVTAEFDSAATGDTTSRPQAKRITAKGNASSYYQMAGSGSTKSIPNVNYVRGRVIIVNFADKAVSTVDVIDKASGVYLEPAAPATKSATPGTRSPTTKGTTGTTTPPVNRPRKTP